MILYQRKGGASAVQRESFYQVGMPVWDLRCSEKTLQMDRPDMLGDNLIRSVGPSQEMGGLARSRPGDLFENHFNFGSQNLNFSIPPLGLSRSAKLLYLNEQLWIFDWKINDKIASSWTDKWFWSRRERRRSTEINKRDGDKWSQVCMRTDEGMADHSRPGQTRVKTDWCQIPWRWEGN